MRIITRSGVQDNNWTPQVMFDYFKDQILIPFGEKQTKYDIEAFDLYLKNGHITYDGTDEELREFRELFSSFNKKMLEENKKIEE